MYIVDVALGLFKVPDEMLVILLKVKSMYAKAGNFEI